MFPLFYYHPVQKTFKWKKEPGCVQVVCHKSKYGTLDDNEFRELPDQSRIVSQFKNMVFLDQCYWD